MHREGKAFLLALFQKHRDIRATASVLTELQKETFLQAKKGTSSMSMLELINKFGPEGAMKKAKACRLAGRVTVDDDYPEDESLFLYEVGTGRQTESATSV